MKQKSESDQTSKAAAMFFSLITIVGQFYDVVRVFLFQFEADMFGLTMSIAVVPLF